MSDKNKNEGFGEVAETIMRQHIRDGALNELRAGTGGHADAIWAEIGDAVLARHAEVAPAHVTAASIADATGHVLKARLRGNAGDGPARTVDITSEAARAVVEKTGVLVRVFAGTSVESVLSTVLADVAGRGVTADTDVREAVGAAILSRLTAK